MKRSLGKLLVAIILTMLLGLPALAPGYQVTSFSDGTGEKTLVFSESINEGTVLISIPRATNLSGAQMIVEGGSSTVGSATSISDFSAGIGINVTTGNDLKLTSESKWWNNSWAYRLYIDVAFPRNFSNIVIEKDINLSQAMELLGLQGKAIDGASLRIVERGDNNNYVPYNLTRTGGAEFLLPSEVSQLPGYDSAQNAQLHVRWLLPGNSSTSAIRHFELYFDSVDHPDMPAVALPPNYPDILYSNSEGSPPVDWLYKNNAGQFNTTPDAVFDVGPSMGLAVDDVNSDGYPDVIFPEYQNPDTYAFDGTSKLFLGNKDGIDNSTSIDFQTVGAYAATVADLNNDGLKDVIFACRNNFSRYNVQSVAFLQSQNGSFNSTPDFYFNTSGANGVEAADLNNDGWMDLAFSCERSKTSGNIFSQIYYGSPAGFNQTPDASLPTQGAHAVAIADLNKDGWLDLVFANSRNSSVAPPNDVQVPSEIFYGGPNGFNSTPDATLDTTGAAEVKIADLNLDGWLDIIFANYNDGATTSTLSSAYFGSSNGFDPHTPSTWFETSWALGLAVGDLNQDGNPDVAFANYFDGSTFAIDSTIFYGPCVGLKSMPAVELPTVGATGVAISNIGYYQMASDRNPPVITIDNPTGPFVPNGTYLGPNLPMDENVLSASATWNATIPAQPAGCNLSVFISNDAGVDWVQLQQGVTVNFTTTGQILKYKVELSSDPHDVGTPVFQDITITYTKESYPFNVKLDLNADGRDEWSWPGKFNTTAVLNETTMGLATWLMQTVPRTGSGNFTVPFKFSSESPGIIRVFGLDITGNYPPEAMMPIPDIVMTENIPLVNAFNVHNYFRHLDPDPLQYLTVGNRNVFLNISDNGSVTINSATGWYGEERFILRAIDNQGEWADIPMDVEVRHVAQPPGFIAKMPDVAVSEGDTVFSAFNLLDYVFDPDTPKTSLIFSVADVSDPNVSVSMDANDNIDVHSKTGWDGVAVVKMKVSDGELNDVAAFNVTVVRHNRPPTVGQLPPVQLGQGERFIHAFNMRNFTSDVDTPMANITFRIEDNSNLLSGVSVDRDGWVNITPDPKWYGVAVVMVNASDGEYGVLASFTVTVNPKPTTKAATAADNTLMYILIALFIVFIVVFAVDMGLRSRRPKGPTPPPASAAPAVVSPRPTPLIRRMRVQPARIVGTTPVEPPAEAPPEQLQMDKPAPAVAPEQGLGAGAAATLAAAAGEPVQAEGRSDIMSTEQGPPGVEGGLAPVPSDQGAPPVQAPEPTVAAPAPPMARGEGWQGTMEPAPVAPAEEVPPSPEAGAEAWQRPAGRSAAALLAALQKPAPMAGEAQPAPGPEEVQGAPPSPSMAGARPPAVPSAEAGPGVGPGEPATTAPTLAPEATGGEPAATEPGQKEVRPITRVRCAGCKTAIPIFSAQRPLVVTCPQCGRMGMLK